MKLRYKIVNGILLFFAVAITALALLIGHTADCGPAPTLSADAERVKAITYRCYGSTDVLEFADIEKPVPADNEVLVKVRAAAVNPLDWHFMRGTPYLMRLDTGLSKPRHTVLGRDFAGTVESVGENVSNFKPGDEVYGTANGAFADYLTIRSHGSLALKPANMSFEQSAAVPIAGITALQALRDYGKIESGQKVLINGASGGVGTFAVQIAKSFGAEVTGVCSTRNVEMVRALGADRIFDYKKEDYTKSGQRYDLIIDMVSNHSLSENRHALKPGGIYVIVGGPSSDWIGFMANPIKALILSAFVDEELGMMLADVSNADLNVLTELMQAGKMTPLIDRRFSLNDTAAAIQYSEEGHTRGKIVINLD